MKPVTAICLLVAAAHGLTGCAAPVRSLFPPPAGQPTRTVYVVSHGWHTGLVMERADLTDADWARAFPMAEALEVGWGDAAFYPADRPGLWMTIKAALWPTPSVLHVVGFNGPLTNRFPHQEIIRIKLSEPGFDRLRRHVETSFARDAAGQLQPAGPGLSDDSRFYQARDKFFFPRMCNRWVARGLRAAGCPIQPWRVITAGHVMKPARRFGQLIQAAPHPPKNH